MAVVIDNGSGMCKAGFEAEESPKCCFPSVVGYPKQKSVVSTNEQEDHYIGEKAIEKRGVLRLIRSSTVRSRTRQATRVA